MPGGVEASSLFYEGVRSVITCIDNGLVVQYVFFATDLWSHDVRIMPYGTERIVIFVTQSHHATLF
jgi:hypothetical protein